MSDQKSLESRLLELEKENTYLKRLLDQAGIPYKQVPASSETSASAFVSDQGDRILPAEITYRHARKFFSYFWGRTDVFSKRYQNKTTGKAGYYTQCENFWRRGVCPRAFGTKIKCRDCGNRVWTELKAGHIEAHLRGEREDASDVIGVYPLFPDGTCRFLVFDFDNHSTGADEQDNANEEESWKEEVDSLREICRINGIPVLVERSRSGRGAHIWIFFDKPITAVTARRFGFALLDKGAEAVNLKSFRYYDRMLPAQDEISEGELGNLIALPLQGQALKSGNSAFIDEDWNAYPDQWKILLSTERLPKEFIEKKLEEWQKTDQKQNQSIPEDYVRPWERTRQFHKEDIEGNLKIVLSNRIYVETANLKSRLQNQIRRMAAFSNPEFFKNKAIGLSNYNSSRFIYLGEDDNGYICLPRGLLEALTEACGNAGIKTEIQDERCSGRAISAVFSGELRDNQKIAVRQLLKFDCGILSAATAFGKTVVCSNIIAQRKTSTLILLESSALIEQWENALNTFLKIDEELPTYQTKTGRVKKRKSIVGVIQGARDTSTGIVDIAMAGSLCKKGEFHPRLKEYGLVLVDECHHSASDTMRNVLQEVHAKYVYGVTATPFRGDGLERINEMLLGPVRFRYTAKEKAAEQGIPHLVYPRFTRTVSPHGQDLQHVNDAYELIRDNDVRNQQIAEDIRAAVGRGRTPVVLTRYTEHADTLYDLVKHDADHVFLLTGKKSKAEQKQLRAEMAAVTDDESMILVATGQLIGEGFDFPRLDTLILATPVSWKGVVEQYAGRLNRDYAGKENVIIYDYIDANIPVFDKMYAKRLRSYKRIGYQLYTEGAPQKQNVNSIYDADTYTPVYEKDLQEAEKSIVISSPTLGRYKVSRMIRILKERQEAGTRVTVVTWHPDAYVHGREEHRIALMEELRSAGFHIVLAEESCERYAVIDDEIVWYGSMNLLSKDDIDDNIMRVASKEIAAELLEITFRKDHAPEEYCLPI